MLILVLLPPAVNIDVFEPATEATELVDVVAEIGADDPTPLVEEEVPPSNIFSTLRCRSNMLGSGA